MHILSKSRSRRILLIVVCSEISTLAPSHRGDIERVAADLVPVPWRQSQSRAQTNGCYGKFSLSNSKVTLTALLTNGEKGCAGGVREVLRNKNRRHPDASFKRGEQVEKNKRNPHFELSGVGTPRQLYVKRLRQRRRSSRSTFQSVPPNSLPPQFSSAPPPLSPPLPLCLPLFLW